MARDLKTDMQTLRTVLNYAENRDFLQAAALAEKTLASGFEHPMLLNIVATRLEQEDRLEEALQLLKRAVAISPTDIGARNALALCLQRLDRPAEALHHVDELLRQHADLPFAHANKGNALIALGALGQAKECHLRALALEPGNLAATVALASIATQRGEHAEARRFAEEALRKAPGIPDAVMSLAAAELANGATGTAETLLHQLIIDSRASQLDRARATSLLADVLDAAGRYRQAFDAYDTCNQALRQIYGRFAGSGALAYARSLTAAVQQVSPAEWQANPSSDADSEALDHVFLVGFPRSGTTLLEVVLDGHPGIVSLEEHELLIDGVRRFMREPVSFEPLAHASEAELIPLRSAYWRGVRAARVQVAGKVFIDKHPLNTLKLPLIAKLFPRAKILFAVRDPRDVVLSCFRRRFKMNPAMYELLTLPGAASFYDAVMTFADAAMPALARPWHTVRYETLVGGLETEMRGICEFIGVEWMAEMSDFAARVQAREHATPSTAQLSRGLVTSGLEHWRHYELALEPLMPILEPWLRRFGYIAPPSQR
jgi:tetratricopeptide (TPR) repeat protein